MLSIAFFFLTAIGIPAAAIVSLVAVTRRKYLTAQIAGITAVAWPVLYVALLYGFSILGPQPIYAMHQPFPLCGPSCELSIEGEKAERDSSGRCLVTVKVALQKDALAQGAVEPVVTLIDSQGARYAPTGSTDDQPLDRFVEPGESFSKTFIYNPPPTAQPTYLEVRDGAGLSRFVIDDTNSPRHKQPYIRLEFAEKR